MTSTPSETLPFDLAQLGTLVLLPWSSGAADGADMPYLLAYSLGDADGPGTTAAAVEALLASNGLTAGGALFDGTAEGTGLTITLRVEGGEAVVDLPQLGARCAAPPAWLTAVGERGYAYLVFTTRPWPEGRPGQPIDAEVLTSFVTAEQTLRAAAHVVLPAQGPRA